MGGARAKTKTETTRKAPTNYLLQQNSALRRSNYALSLQREVPTMRSGSRVLVVYFAFFLQENKCNPNPTVGNQE